MEWGQLYLIALTVIVLIFLVYYFFVLNVDTRSYFQYLYKLNVDVVNENLMKLLNANSIVNLPNINIITNNPEIDDMQKCKQGAIFMGTDPSYDYTSNCFNTCGSSGKVIHVDSDTERYSNGEKLKPGYWCVINDVYCNFNTGYVIATINSVTCRSKYPHMFGGEAADRIVACRNEFSPSNGSQLWDYYMNEAVDPLTVKMSHENETLDDGSYRFKCKFSDDDFGNLYIAHPHDRFQPITDVCIDKVWRASREAHVVYERDGEWKCECGDFEYTRIKHEDENDPKSTCTSCYFEINDKEYRVPRECFTINSNFTDAGNKLPCQGEKFTRMGNFCETLHLVLEKVTILPEPYYFRIPMPFIPVEIAQNKLEHTWSRFK